jgi:glycosyltransferase involved in cell wall biosynthesis
MVAVGVGKSLVPLLRSIGVHAYPYLPHNEYLSLLKASDLYFLPATRQIFYGGIAMALVEALALGKPVVSPTLIHYPEKKIIPHIGITPPYMDSEASLNKFVDALSYAIENISLFKVERYRDNIARYYSWESFVRDFAMAVNRL